MGIFKNRQTHRNPKPRAVLLLSNYTQMCFGGSGQHTVLHGS